MCREPGKGLYSRFYPQISQRATDWMTSGTGLNCESGFFLRVKRFAGHVVGGCVVARCGTRDREPRNTRKKRKGAMLGIGGGSVEQEDYGVR